MEDETVETGNPTEVVKLRDPIVRDKDESNILFGLIVEKIVNALEHYGYDNLRLNTLLIRTTQLSEAGKLDFNYVLKMIKNKFKLNLFDVITYLDKYAPVESIIELLDSGVMAILKEETKERYHVKNGLIRQTKQEKVKNVKLPEFTTDDFFSY